MCPRGPSQRALDHTECGPRATPRGLTGSWGPTWVPRLCLLSHLPDGGRVPSHVPAGTASGAPGGGARLWGAGSQRKLPLDSQRGQHPKGSLPTHQITWGGPRSRPQGQSLWGWLQDWEFKNVYINILIHFIFPFWRRGNRLYMQMIQKGKGTREGHPKEGASPAFSATERHLFCHPSLTGPPGQPRPRGSVSVRVPVWPTVLTSHC